MRVLRALQFVLGMALLPYAAADAACLRVQLPAALPSLLPAGSCVELSGRGVLPAAMVLKGRMIVRRGTQLSVEHGLTLTDKAQLLQRGTLRLAQGKLELQKGAQLVNYGTLQLAADSKLEVAAGAAFTNSGLSELSAAQVDTEGVVENFGRLQLYAAALRCSAGGLRNGGILHLQGMSILQLHGDCQLQNVGTLQQDAEATMELSSQAQFINQRQLQFAGNVAQQGDSVWLNQRRLELLPTALWYVGGRGALINEQNATQQGQLLLTDSASFVNKGSWYGEADSLIRVGGEAHFTNNGNFRARGRVVREENGVIENIKEWVK